MNRTKWVACVMALAGALWGSVLTGCDGGGGTTTPGTDGGTTTPPTDSGTTTPPTDSGTTTPPTDSGTTTPPPMAGWTFHTHPCSGNRTDTLWVDPDGTAYVGCGSTTTGDQGFYLSTDGGETWSAPTTSPARYFNSWRVQDISRGPDGLLYVAGINTGNSHRVVSVNTNATPWAVELVLQSQPRVGFAFTVGSFRRNADGFAIAESLNGTDILYRTSDGGEWTDGSAWDDDFGGLQILQLVEHDGLFYGSGSRISQPPYLFISRPPAEGFGFRILELATGIGAFNGEMWGIAVDDGGIVVGGVNQSSGIGMIYALDHGATETRVMDVSTFYPSDATWIRGVCRRGAELVAVGELSRRSDGIVLRSTDNGATWNNITPAADSFPSMHRCQVVEAGVVWAAGADGRFAVYAAPE
jgi:hypothetical protein